MFKKTQKIGIIFLLVLTAVIAFQFVETSQATLFGDNVKDPLQTIQSDEVRGTMQASKLGTSPSLMMVFMGWIKFFLPYASILAFIGIVYAGFLYVSSYAQEENIEKAKKILVWSIMGLILIFSAYVIVSAFIKPVIE